MTTTQLLGAVVDTQKLHTCTSCGFRGTADRMLNLNRRFTNGQLHIFCRKCARSCPKELTLYRLDATLKRDAERKREELGARSIFAKALAHKRELETPKDEAKNGDGDRRHPPT